jgi:serine/threonine protein kinase
MATEGSDDRLADILAAYMDRRNAGEAVDEAIVRVEHPDLAGELILELGTLGALGPRRASPENLGALGDYTLLRLVGRGGMGAVYEAREGSMDRRVALKLLHPSVAADTRAVTRFVREARAAGKLHHPNVVPVHGIGVNDDVPYYAMEFVDGETLARILLRLRAGNGAGDGWASPFGSPEVDLGYCARVAEAFAGAAEGLHHAHGKGVIHRDLKPPRATSSARPST